jgi:aspartyl-tRNA(Asn)/glutamyl-tRNA(Gln) amidotransferase subunit C
MTEKKISIEDVEQVARLTRLGLSAADKELFGRQLNNILLYMEKLDELETGGVDPLAHILPLHNVLRADRVRRELSQAEVLKNAPDQKEGFFKVPPVIE